MERVLSWPVKRYVQIQEYIYCEFLVLAEIGGTGCVQNTPTGFGNTLPLPSPRSIRASIYYPPDLGFMSSWHKIMVVSIFNMDLVI